MNRILAFFFVSVFMLANGSLFTWLFRGTPLLVWRQLIWGIGLIVLYRSLRTINSAQLIRTINIHLIFFVVILIQALFTFAIYNFNFLRLSFAFWNYFSGLPFLLLPYLFVSYAEERNLPSTKFYDIFVGLGIFLTVGLIIDFVSKGFFTKMFLISMSSSLEGLLKDGRFCFLSEAPTTFGVYYCFCLLCVLNRLYLATTNQAKFVLLLISLSFIIGGWLTGSRQIVLVLCLVFVVSFGYYTFFVNDRKQYILFAIILSFLVAPSVYSFMFSDNAYKNRYSVATMQKDSRYLAWERGFKENVTDDIIIFFVGKAVALAQGQKAIKGELQGSHYENTYFSRISEVGILGVILLVWPFIYLLTHWKQSSLFNITLLSFYFSYLIISYISPNGSHQTTQMVVYLALGLFLNKDYFSGTFYAERYDKK